MFPATVEKNRIQEIEWEVVLWRRIHKRTRYKSTCDCKAVPGIVTAPPPPKLIPKGIFAISFWVRLILEKFFFQKNGSLPISRPALTFRPVETREDSSLWNELIERYHYLKYKPLPGAQIRYLVFSDLHLPAALGFGAAAWTVAPRDHFIGWTAEQRKRNLSLIVNNARLLILPWITSRNLASRMLAAVAKRLPKDWEIRYGYAPVLLETFVEKHRFRGTCYRAANWILVDQTQGRGKPDRKNLRALPVKDIFLYPLHKHFRRILRTLP